MQSQKNQGTRIGHLLAVAAVFQLWLSPNPADAASCAQDSSLKTFSDMDVVDLTARTVLKNNSSYTLDVTFLREVGKKMTTITIGPSSEGEATFKYRDGAKQKQNQITTLTATINGEDESLSCIYAISESSSNGKDKTRWHAKAGCDRDGNDATSFTVTSCDQDWHNSRTQWHTVYTVEDT